MSNVETRIKWVVWAGLAFVGLLLVSILLVTGWSLRSRGEQPLPVYGSIADFTLTNQEGQAVSLTDLRGRVWVADIIFTRCAGSCPGMSRQMKGLQAALDGDDQVKLVTLTTDPEYDTPPILKRYADRFKADPKRWIFLTGTKQEIAELAVNSLKFSALPKKPGERLSPKDLFVHSTIFVVVGKQGRLRGVFETTGEGVDPELVKSRILDAIHQLERET